MTIEEIRKSTEFQVFDPKSARIDAKALAITIIAFANADGGRIAIGVEDDGALTGVDGKTEHVNELLRASYDYCVPSIATSTEYMDVTDVNGQPNHIILMTVPQSVRVHANQADEVYYRVGDSLRKRLRKMKADPIYPARSWQGVGKEFGLDFNVLKTIADFCVEARSLSEIAEHVGLSDRYKMKVKYIDPLLGKYFEMTIPDLPNNPGQKYYLTASGKALSDND